MKNAPSTGSNMYTLETSLKYTYEYFHYNNTHCAEFLIVFGQQLAVLFL